MTEADLLAIDESSRLRALAPASFIVEAPAGAGKTELLTQRYLSLLAQVKEPEEIIAITFTNKAAAEMRARILASLTSATVETATQALPAHKRITRSLALAALTRDAGLGWGLLKNPVRLRITTIDALSAGLARQMPFLSRFGAQPLVSEDAAVHYEAAALRTLALLEEGGEEGNTVAAALRYFSNDAGRLQKLIVSMLARRDQWLVNIDAAGQHEGSAIGILVASDLARAAALLDTGMQTAIMPAARYAAGNLIAAGRDSPITLLADWSQPLAGEIEALERWRGAAALLLTSSGTLRKRLDKNMGLPAEKEAKPFKEAVTACCAALSQMPGAEAALARIQEMPEPALDAEEARIVAVFARLLKLASAQLWMVFQQQREVDFIEIAQRALAALGELDEPSSLQLKLDYRISHLLVDEFQDTSPAQIALLERLTAGWQQDDGRTLFVVGDPMQSIYRFRKADVGLFLQARDVGIGSIRLEALRLNLNNRSHPEVVDWINATFPEVFPAADNPQSGAVKFASSVATKPPLSPGPSPARREGGVIVHPVLVDSQSDEGDIDEARTVIGILRRTREENPAGSIAILVRARSHLDALVTELRRSAPDLRYQAVDIEVLAERQIVQDLLALTRALHHRADRVNWLAILRAPWCGLLLADLHVLAGDDHDKTLWALMNDSVRCERLSADGQQRLWHVREVLAEALAHQGRLRTRRWIEAAWRMLGGEDCLHDAAERADAEAFFGLIDQMEGSGGFTLERLDRDMARLYAAPDPRAGDAIQIMTVHKSKGLEFDTVILPGLHRATRNGDHSLLLWEEFVDGHGHEHLVIAPVKPIRSASDKRPSAYDYLRTLDAERESNESSRVLYVAATRAIRALHLVAVATVSDDGHGGESGNPVSLEVKPPKKGSPLAVLWPAVEADFTIALGEGQAGIEGAAGEASPLAGFVPRLSRLAAPVIPACLQGEANDTGTLCSPGMSCGHADSFVSAQDRPVEAQGDTDDYQRSLLADIGRLAHRTLELIAQDGLDQWNVERVKASLPAFTRWLMGRGHAASVLDAAAIRVQEAVCNAISSEAGRWILAPRDGDGNELSLTSSRGGQVLSNVIDRTFVENGERWIIDYKTARFGSDAPESEFIAWAEIYRPQLERYAALFPGEALPVHMGVFFIAHGRLVMLAGDSAGSMEN